MTEQNVSVAQARTMRGNINLVGRVKSKGDTRTVNLKNGGTVDVCDSIITDGPSEDDSMTLTLWGDDIKKIHVDSEVSITNGYTNEFKGNVSLGTGKFGKLEITKP